MGRLLRYPYEVRSEEEYFDEIQDVKVTGASDLKISRTTMRPISTRTSRSRT